jgi:hypothetical protein
VRYTSKKAFKILFVTAVLMSVSAYRARGKSTEIGGRIYFRSGLMLELDEVSSQIFSVRDGAESVPRHVTDWVKHCEKAPISTFIPIAWVISVIMKDMKSRIISGAC